MTALAKTRNAEVSAMAHAAHSFSRLSVRSFRYAEDMPHLAGKWLAEGRQHRQRAKHYLAWARREKAHSRAQALPVLATFDMEPA